ncbi:uncharacterized protein ASCRUDRAFT_143081 [Ascoidea rubescens DSM 1968]|uniref:Uncharacterized protein n=1 Tax=Ascoidea rubescens DSM 1968 TaxID=1344418 RepID=A0A1D2VIU2_9ASCO|nr:hypothetical protein ASCRUDRAFT_143081 [Ascoidea rubescens DSM 1968]ODV61544.1 hypothetical protein ASCRUDRAFT_143081 [Ascoidea rubescens DSM 1968]
MSPPPEIPVMILLFLSKCYHIGLKKMYFQKMHLISWQINCHLFIFSVYIFFLNVYYSKRLIASSVLNQIKSKFPNHHTYNQILKSSWNITTEEIEALNLVTMDETLRVFIRKTSKFIENYFISAVFKSITGSKFNGFSTSKFIYLNKKFKSIQLLFGGLSSYILLVQYLPLVIEYAKEITGYIGANYHNLDGDVSIIEAALGGFRWINISTQLDAVELLKGPGVIDIKRIKELLDLQAELEK